MLSIFETIALPIAPEGLVHRRERASQSASSSRYQVVEDGWARVRDKSGRQVALRNVVVFESELRGLQSTLNFLHAQFEELVDPAKRGDVENVLSALQVASLAIAAGQKIKEDTH